MTVKLAGLPLLFAVKKGNVQGLGFGEGLDGFAPQRKKEFPLKMAREKEWD